MDSSDLLNKLNISGGDWKNSLSLMLDESKLRAASE
jgi:hypothetical protein